ncbi:hypothetical protein [Providencia rettgeri]|uniref:hypothetical protein n=1 Tax=Providencia rettgeri TaxID=587 RepID=UPI0013F3F8B6|nr:hypothetical protein [Providencia rettgeri]ELR5038683.1 hypothetical protein [Providencia stuartii]ELR5082943.1 hypothetical protein [Providencia stuartii]
MIWKVEVDEIIKGSIYRATFSDNDTGDVFNSFEFEAASIDDANNAIQEVVFKELKK